MTDDFFTCDFFTLFGLPQSISIDEKVLSSCYHRLQQQVHPDRFVGSSEVERRVALSMSSRLNDAFTTLKSPLSRVAYLLSLSGMDVFSETDTSMPIDFLEELLEKREEIASAKNNEERQREILAEIKCSLEEIIASVDSCLNTGDMRGAYEKVRQWIYIEKLIKEVKG